MISLTRDQLSRIMTSTVDAAKTADCRILLSALVSRIDRNQISIEELIEIIEDLQDKQSETAVVLGMLMRAIRDA